MVVRTRKTFGRSNQTQSWGRPPTRRKTKAFVRILSLWSRQIRWTSPSGLGDSESKGEGPQPRTVKAMCKAKWPTQRRLTEAQQAALERAATCGLEGAPPREEGVASPRGPGATIECG